MKGGIQGNGLRRYRNPQSFWKVFQGEAVQKVQSSDRADWMLPLLGASPLLGTDSVLGLGGVVGMSYGRQNSTGIGERISAHVSI